MVSIGIVKGMNVPGLDDEKRYNQLVDVMVLANGDFTAAKFWAYGCNCQMAQSIADPGRGTPKDALDSTCKRYKGSYFNLGAYMTHISGTRLYSMRGNGVW